MPRPFRMPAARRVAALAVAAAAVAAEVTVAAQPSTDRGCPSGGVCRPAAGEQPVPLADGAYNWWTLDLDIGVLRLKAAPVL